MPGRWPGSCLALAPVRDRPEGVSERELERALTQGWDIEPAALTYAPVGAGSYHWVVTGARGGRWFVTVDDLDHKSWLGSTRSAALAGLRMALNTAHALRDQAGLGFVVAPIPGRDGATAELVNSRYAASVYPYLDGASGQFGQPLPGPARARLVDMLAALHQVTPTSPVPVADARLTLRPMLETALSELDGPWSGGPFSDPARVLLASSAGPIRELLAAFDRLADRLAAAPDLVITHGEPHPGNLLHTEGGPRLIDWDTVGLAWPERDLWSVLSETGEEARRYTEATGRAINPDAVTFYRIRWTLDDLAAFTQQLRAGHGHTEDAAEAWQDLRDTVADAAREAAAGDADGSR
jgi:spectinomycin phosphotransferase